MAADDRDAEIIDLAEANLRDEDLSGLDLSFANLSGADLTGADLTGTRLDGANLSSAVLDRAILHRTSLVGATLVAATLGSADLSVVDLTDADLTDADLYGAAFDRVNFRGARLVRVSFGNAANVEGIGGATDLTGTDLSDMTEMPPRTRVNCREKGATGVEGFPCPQCAYWDGARPGLDPGCETCDTKGMVDWDPEVARAKRPIPCPWCDGRGWFSSMPNTWGCMVCNGLGRVEPWAVDLKFGYDQSEGYDPAAMDVHGIDFSAEDFVDGRIENATFRECSFEHMGFTRAELTDVVFVRCNVTGADFSEARLTRVQFDSSQLSESVWTDAQIDNVELVGCETSDMELEPGLQARLSISSDATE